MRLKPKPNVTVGALVYSAAENPMGTVDTVGDNSFRVNNIIIPFYEIDRIERYGIYLTPRATLIFKENQRIPAANEPVRVQGYTSVLKLSYGQEEVFPGVPVLDLNGHAIGRIKSAKGTYFTVDRMFLPDYKVPYVAVLDASGTRVILRMSGSKIADMEFEKPKQLVGTYS